MERLKHEIYYLYENTCVNFKILKLYIYKGDISLMYFKGWYLYKQYDVCLSLEARYLSGLLI